MRKDLLFRLGQRIMNLRTKAKISQEELAEAVGEVFNTISMLERGQINPKLKLLYAIADYFKISIHDLLD